MIHIISFFVSYFFGSIPTAYFVVRRAANVDIRSVGSGNVGGRNAFEVTGKKWVGVVVVLVDLLKGSAAVFFIPLLYGYDPAIVSAAMVGAVLGHCYPVWLRFKGGRGLATAAGVFLLLSWVWVPVWLVVYYLSEKITTNVHGASVIAIVAIPILLFFIPESMVTQIIPSYFSHMHFFAASSAVMAVCLSRHIEPLQQLTSKQTTNE